VHDASERQVKYLAAGEGRAVWVLGDLYTFKLNSEDTNGEFAIWECVSPVGNAGPPLHRHLRESETFVVLEGELEFWRDDEPVRARPGAVVHIPKGVLHKFRNVGNDPARLLVMVSPGGFERFFMELGEPAQDLSQPPVYDAQPDVAAVVSLALEHDCEIVAPA
jgi:mannose-6-phosphate isomerase-like protein (cupin superfamily)